MKSSAYLMFVCLMGLAVVASVAGFMRAADGGKLSDRSASMPVPIPTDHRDVWDETTAATPPLSPGAAIRIAREYVRLVRVPDYTDGWVVDSLSLRRLAVSGGTGEWVYFVHFQSAPQSGVGPDHAPRLQVPVRFDGMVPPGIVPRIHWPDQAVGAAP
jgi:hypothetical protein